MRDYSNITARTRQLELTPLRLVAQMEATRSWMDRFPGTEIQFQNEIMHALDSEVYRITLDMKAHKGEPITISHPRDWWEAVKLRWAPQWFLRRHMVQMVTHTIWPWAVLPDLKTPPGQRLLRWAEYEGPQGHYWRREDDQP